MTDYAISYCRVSSAEQVEGSSLADQEAANRRYIARQGWTLDGVFIEAGESAKTADRPQLVKALEYCRRNPGRVRFFVVHRLDRFARNQYDHFALKAELLKLGVSLRASEQGIDDSAEGRLMEGIHAAFAQFDNDLRRERCSAGMKAALEKGQWVFPPPVGYRSNPMAPDPKTGPLVRRAFEMVAQGVPTPAVAAKLQALGLRSRNGRKLSRKAVYKLMRNPIYHGRMIVERWGIDRPGTFEPLITQKLFDQVQAVLDGRGRRKGLGPHQRVHPDFPLRRFVCCEGCGQPLTAAWSQGKLRRYGYYWCLSEECRGRVRRSKLEGIFLDHLEEVTPSPTEVQVFDELVRKEWVRSLESSGEEASMIEESIREVENKRQRLLEAYMARALPLEDFQRQRALLDEEVREIRAASHPCTAMAGAELDEMLRFARSLVCELPKVWVSLGTPQKRELQETVFPSGATLDLATLRLRTPERALFPGIYERNGSVGSRSPERGLRTPLTHS